MDRHVLITGGAGYIGSLLTSELLLSGFKVTVIDSLLFGGDSLVPFLPHPNFRFFKADVTERRAVKDAVRGDTAASRRWRRRVRGRRLPRARLSRAGPKRRSRAPRRALVARGVEPS